MAKSKPKDNALAQNRKARHDYNILETYEAGIALTGLANECSYFFIRSRKYF